MPANGQIVVDSTTDKTAVNPTVKYTSLSQFRFANVVNVTQTTGATPGYAEIRISNTVWRDEKINDNILGQDHNLNEKVLKYYSHATITDKGTTFFRGYLTGRKEDSMEGCTRLIYKDARVLAHKIPLRGCWVYDPYEDKAVFTTRYLPHFNPGGYRNCIVGNIPGVPFPVPMFTWIAEAGTAGVSSDEAGSGKAGEICFWTGERALQYISACAIATYPSPWNTMIKKLPSDVTWEFPQFASTSLMKERIPDTDCTGMSLLGAALKVTDITSEYGISMYFSEGNSTIRYYSKDLIKNKTFGINFNVQTSGAVKDFNTPYSYSLQTDATNTYTGVSTDGDVAQVESYFEFNPNNNNGTITKGWTDLEEADFTAIIDGNGETTYAQRPKKLGVTGDLIQMDGTGGTPAIQVNTRQAIQLARACYPNVFRAFRIAMSEPGDSGKVQTIANGFSNKYGDYPQLHMPRPPYPEQLQPFFETGGDLRGRMRMPVRILVASNASAVNYLHDVTANSGFRVTDDGLFHLDGLTDDIGGVDSIYEGSMRLNASNIKLKYFFINMAMPIDTRIHADADLFRGNVQDVRGVKDMIDSKISNGTNLGMNYYVLNIDGYKDEHQVDSRPAPQAEFPDAFGKNGGAAPLSRLLRTDTDQIKKHTVRRIKDVSMIKRSGQWRFPGIHSDKYAGVLVEKIKLDQTEWPAGRSIGVVVYDFQNQETIVELE